MIVGRSLLVGFLDGAAADRCVCGTDSLTGSGEVGLDYVDGAGEVVDLGLLRKGECNEVGQKEPE